MGLSITAVRVHSCVRLRVVSIGEMKKTVPRAGKSYTSFLDTPCSFNLARDSVAGDTTRRNPQRFGIILATTQCDDSFGAGCQCVRYSVKLLSNLASANPRRLPA